MTKPIASLFKQLTHGVYVVGVADGESQNAFTAAWVMQAAFKPLLLAVAVNVQHASYGQLKRSGAFSVNVLGKNQLELARHFGEPASAAKLASVAWRTARTGAPILEDSLAYFDLRFSHECPSGDHSIVVGQVVDGALLQPNRIPMNYRDTGNMDGSEALFPNAF
jgi:flavin reductase (DIM6/NTAB) family NADH-FMN oxidoreductase RutF